MTLEEEYPNAVLHFTTDDGFMRGSSRPSECAYCERPTNWYHRVLDLRFCSRECHKRFESEGRTAEND